LWPVFRVGAGLFLWGLSPLGSSVFNAVPGATQPAVARLTSASSSPLADLYRNRGEQHVQGCIFDTSYTRRGMAQGRTVSGGWRCDGGAAQNFLGGDVFCAAPGRRSGGERHSLPDNARGDRINPFEAAFPFVRHAQKVNEGLTA